MALTKLDLKNIGKLIKKNLGILRKEINKDIGNLVSDEILPQFDSLNDQFEGVNRKIDALFERGDLQEKQLDNHEGRITKLGSFFKLALTFLKHLVQSNHLPFLPFKKPLKV